MESFFDYYELYNSTSELNEKFDKNLVDKNCKFCGQNSTTVSFKNIPHIIPELFGKNNSTSNFECDACNSKFQKFESDTATMIQHFIALSGVKTKKGIPTFKSKKTRETYPTSLTVEENNRNLNFGTNLSDFDYDEEKNKLTVRFRTRRFRPYSVYKIFLKIGISLLKYDDLKINQHYLDFLNSEEPINNGMQVWKAFRYMMKTKYRKTPQAHLYKAKKVVIENTEFPEYILIIQFANIVFQMFLPITEKNMETHLKTNTLRLDLFPAFIQEDISQLSKIELYNIDLSETDKISITDEIQMFYDRKNQNS